MDTESLERLAIDRALGTLAPEVEALLADYLAHDPTAAALVDEFAETARLAKGAFGDGPSVAPPPFPLGRMQLARRPSRRRTRLKGYVMVTVSLILGVGLGLLVSRYPTHQETPPSPFTTQQIVNVPHPPTTPVAEKSTTSFWSRERLIERALAASPARRPRLVWTSPIRPPIMEVSHDTLDSGT